jgi:hypothetical protein
MNTKSFIALPDWPQFNAATTGLKLLRQIQTNTHVFAKPSPLGKRNTLVKVPWTLNSLVTDRDTSVKMSPTRVKSMASTCDIDNI